MKEIKTNLYKETTIGGIKVRNHFVRSATHEGKATEDGFPTEAIKNVYIGLTKNEVGIIITSFSSIADYEQASKNQLGIYKDELIPAYKEITDAVHAEGGSIVMQIFHGSSTAQAYPDKARILGPSAVENPFSGLIPEEMTIEDIQLATSLFADAAVRVKKAGFDGVQLHGAHSGLLSQFLSQTFNHRTDEYGGTRENRFRFVREVYEAVRNAVGPEYPIWIKLDSTDGFPGGLSVDDFLWNAKQLSELGINAIEVSGMGAHGASKGAYYKDAAEKLADMVETSVILTGGIRSMDDILPICKESKVQFFGFARPFMAHSDFLLKIKEM